MIDTVGQRRDRQGVVVRSIVVDMHSNYAMLAAVVAVDYPTS